MSGQPAVGFSHQKHAREIADELRHLRLVIRDEGLDSAPKYAFAWHRGGVCGLNSRVDGILATAAKLLEEYPDAPS